MSFRRDAYCGLYCGACPHFLATENGTLETFAAEKGMTPDEALCHGCKSDHLRVNAWCASCTYKACAREKGFDFCYECADYPCEGLVGFINDQDWPYHILVPENMERIQQDGLSAWLEAQDARWRCEVCGTKHSWYGGTCETCGAPLRGWQEGN